MIFVGEVTAVCQVGEDDAGVCQVEEVGGAFSGALVTAVYACEDTDFGGWFPFAVGEVEGVFDVEEGAAGHGAVDAGAGVVDHGFIVRECGGGVNWWGVVWRGVPRWKRPFRLFSGERVGETAVIDKLGVSNGRFLIPMQVCAVCYLLYQASSSHFFFGKYNGTSLICTILHMYSSNSFTV